MTCHRFARRLVAYADSFGAGEELIGDLLEEISRGRSQLWVWQQLIGLYGFAVAMYVRSRVRLTPHTIALALCVLLLAAASIGSATSVVIAWLGFYYVTGMLSLFAHMASQTTVDARARVITAPDASNVC